MPLFTRDELEAAVPIVGSFVPPTPAYAWPLLARRTGAIGLILTGGNIDRPVLARVLHGETPGVECPEHCIAPKG